MTLETPAPKASHLGPFLARWAPVAVYVTLIFVVSAQPGLHSPLSFQNADKVAHVIEYGILGWLLARAFGADEPVAGFVAPGLLAIGVGMGIGACDELFQSTVRGRISSVIDWMADTIGLVLAQVLRLAFRRS